MLQYIQQMQRQHILELKWYSPSYIEYISQSSWKLFNYEI